MQVDERRCSFARRRCRGDLQLQPCARLMPAITQLMSQPCQQAVRSTLTCAGRCSLILCAVGHVCLAVCAHLDECRVPSPEASTGPSPSHLGCCLGSVEWLGGGGARSFEDGDAVCVPRLALRRRFAVCLEDARGITRCRPSALSGRWRPHLYAGCTVWWPQVER